MPNRNCKDCDYAWITDLNRRVFCRQGALTSLVHDANIANECRAFLPQAPINLTLRKCKNCKSFHTKNANRIDSKGICRYSCMTPIKDPEEWCEQFQPREELRDEHQGTTK